MHVYALALSGTAHDETATPQGQSRFRIDRVPAGSDYVVAYTQEEPRISGGWSRAVPCGLKATCTDHALLPVTVAAGRTASGIRVADWYAPSGAFPAEPTAAAPAQTPRGIRSVDFRNFTFAPKGAPLLTLHDGREDEPDGSYLVSVRYADFDGDGKDDALVTVGTGKKDAGGYSEDYYVYLERNGRPRLVWHDSREKPRQVRIEGNSIVIVAPFWKDGDPGCCPSAIETAVYRWRHGRFVRLSRQLKPRP